MTKEYVFAVPGELSIVDVVRDDGLSSVFGHTLAEIRARYPGAEVVPMDAWRAARAAEQDRPVAWVLVTAELFEEMLCVLPPIALSYAGFLVGEPCDHHAGNGQPRYRAYIRHADAHYSSTRPMTVAEYLALDRTALTMYD